MKTLREQSDIWNQRYHSIAEGTRYHLDDDHDILWDLVAENWPDEWEVYEQAMFEGKI